MPSTTHPQNSIDGDGSHGLTNAQMVFNQPNYYVPGQASTWEAAGTSLPIFMSEKLD